MSLHHLETTCVLLGHEKLRKRREFDDLYYYSSLQLRSPCEQFSPSLFSRRHRSSWLGIDQSSPRHWSSDYESLARDSTFIPPSPRDRVRNDVSTQSRDTTFKAMCLYLGADLMDLGSINFKLPGSCRTHSGAGANNSRSSLKLQKLQDSDSVQMFFGRN
jgi:hypothetical protein